MNGRTEVKIEIPADEHTLARIRKAIDRQLGQLRETGTVEVLKDVRIALYVELTPFNQERDESADWGQVCEPTRMWLDPDWLIVPRLRELAAAS